MATLMLALFDVIPPNQSLNAQGKYLSNAFFFMSEKRMHIDDKEKMYESWKNMWPGFSNEVL